MKEPEQTGNGNLLTDRSFWARYWEQKDGLSVPIPANYLFSKELRKIIHSRGVKTAIELGGFPGYYAVFLKRYFDLDVTLLDYFIHRPITDSLLKANGLATADVKVIETDLFNHQVNERYDLVLSCGLIEHFNDTEDIIKRHVRFLNPGGTLLITLPNFRALNGWFQKKYDKENYDKHNISSMDPGLLAEICRLQGLNIVQSRFYGHFSLWLENERTKPAAVRMLKKCVWLTGKILSKLLPFDSRAFSPYIILEATKNAEA